MSLLGDPARKLVPVFADIVDMDSRITDLQAMLKTAHFIGEGNH